MLNTQETYAEGMDSLIEHYTINGIRSENDIEWIKFLLADIKSTNPNLLGKNIFYLIEKLDVTRPKIVLTKQLNV